MIEPKYKIGIEFYKLHDYWSLGVSYGANVEHQLSIMLFKWQINIGRVVDRSE